MKGKLIGVVIFIVIIAAAIGISVFQGNKPQIVVKGPVGGEKTGFLDDTQVKDIFRSKYGITVDYIKAGSIEMVKGDIEGYDFLFPSSQTALEIFKTEKGQSLLHSTNVFNSPIVFFSWDIVADALAQRGIITREGQVNYLDLPAFIDLINRGTSWSDIGLAELYGKVTVIPTDPTKSNSGNMFFGLLANILNGGEVVDEVSIEGVIPSIKQFYNSLGYLERSSYDLFEQYLRTGAGAKPIIVGYENQIVEFAVADPDTWKSVKDRIRILYPVPTVWSEHPIISLTSKGSDFMNALEDEDIQRLAWEKHGFRTGLMGVQNDPKLLDVVGIPENINKVMPMPKPDVMERIITVLLSK